MAVFMVQPGSGPASIGIPESGGTVTNVGSSTVYYGGSLAVTDTTYDGSLAANSSVTLYGSTFFYMPRFDASSPPVQQAPSELLVQPLIAAATTAKALLPFRSALADRLSNPCNILVMGDSTDEGTGVGTLATQRRLSWPDRLAAALRTRFPTPGETVEAEANYLPVNTTSTVVTGVAKTVGFSAASTQYGVNANAARSTAAGDQLTFSLPVGVSGFKVVSLGGTSATGYNLNIDGAGAGSTLGSPGVGSTNASYVSPLQSVAAGSPHTVVLTTIGTNNYVFGLLVYAGNETKGIRVYNGAKHGSRAENYRFGGSYNWVLANETATLLSGPQSVIPMDPHLIIIGWGINDYTSNSPDVTAASYRSYLEAIVTAARAMIPTRQIPVLVVGKWKPNAAQSGIGTWEELRGARAAMVAADPLAVGLDVGLTFPDIGSSQGTTLGLYADTLHSNQKGYQLVADMVASLLAN